ncbi:MAG: DUF6438 domain-containing protein [Bacteroidota bacterium]
MYRLTFFLLILLFGLSCYPRKRNLAIKELGKVMEMHKTACFGKCPVFGLIIYENGKASYDGRMNTDKLGFHTRQLSKKEFKAIRKAFDKADLWQYQDEYRSDIHDLPFIGIRYHKGDKSKYINGDVARPEAVKALEEQMDAIAQADGWTLIEPLKDVPTDKRVIPGELIVRFHPDADIPDWVHKMGAYGIQLKRKLNNSGRLWLVTYDTSTSSPDLIIFQLTETKEVHTAELNRKLQTR